MGQNLWYLAAGWRIFSVSIFPHDWANSINVTASLLLQVISSNFSQPPSIFCLYLKIISLCVTSFLDSHFFFLWSTSLFLSFHNFIFIHISISLSCIFFLFPHLGFFSTSLCLFICIIFLTICPFILTHQRIIKIMLIALIQRPNFIIRSECH